MGGLELREHRLQVIEILHHIANEGPLDRGIRGSGFDLLNLVSHAF